MRNKKFFLEYIQTLLAALLALSLGFIIMLFIRDDPWVTSIHSSKSSISSQRRFGSFIETYPFNLYRGGSLYCLLLWGA